MQYSLGLFIAALEITKDCCHWMKHLQVIHEAHCARILNVFHLNLPS